MARKGFVPDPLDALVYDHAPRIELPPEDGELRYGPAEPWRHPPVRGEGTVPRAVAAPEGALAVAVTDAVVAGLRGSGSDGGRPALINIARQLPMSTASLPGSRQPHTVRRWTPLRMSLTSRQLRGLEFDRVVLADPGGTLARGAKGAHDLHIAVIRVARQLTVVPEGELPEVLSGLVR